MSDKEILKYNKLIAEFMGLKCYEYPNHGKIDYAWKPEFKHSNWNFKDAPPFDRSWDWIMPVIEKIEILGFNVRISTNHIQISKYTTRVQIFIQKRSKIEMCFEAIVEFIKKYNNEKNISG